MTAPASTKPTIGDVTRRAAPIFWAIQQRLERERREKQDKAS